MDPEFGADGSGFRRFPEDPSPLQADGAANPSPERAFSPRPTGLILFRIWAQSSNGEMRGMSEDDEG
jgi:hypothetical protein